MPSHPEPWASVNSPSSSHGLFPWSSSSMASRAPSSSRAPPSHPPANSIASNVVGSGNNGGGGAAGGGGGHVDAKKNDHSSHHGKPGKSTWGGNNGRSKRGGSGWAPHPGASHGAHGGGFNKRPPAKSNPSSSTSSSVTAAADEYQLGSVYKGGSRKQNDATQELFDFHFEQRGFQHRRHNGGGRGRHHQQQGYNTYHRPKYQKDQYLQANCQFVVRSTPDRDYASHLADPDTMVEWSLVEEVRLRTVGHEPPACPICLYPPKAAKISRCGHVFCWACVLHYFALTDDDERTCPICFDLVHKEEDLKSVVSLHQSEVNTGDEIEMHLMRRDRNSLFAVPVGQYFEQINQSHPFVVDGNSSNGNNYSRLLLASPQMVRQVILHRERRELEQQYSIEKDEPEAMFIERAFKELKSRERQLASSAANVVQKLEPVPEDDGQRGRGAQASPTSPVNGGKPKDKSGHHQHAAQAAAKKKKGGKKGCERWEDEKEQEKGHSQLGGGKRKGRKDKGAKIGPDSSDAADAADAADADAGAGAAVGQPTPKDTFYFYQSSDGQALFLHGLNVQMLVSEFGSLEMCPAVLRGQILEKEHASMSVELRQKLRYLHHLPVAARFEMCELRLHQPRLSKQTLALFREQLEARRRRRARRDKNERRREKQIGLEEDKLMGKVADDGSVRVRIESSFHFPEMGVSGGDVDIDAEALSFDFPELDAVDQPPSRRVSESQSSLGTSPASSVGLLDSHMQQLQLNAPDQPSSSTSFATMVRSKSTPVGSSAWAPRPDASRLVLAAAAASALAGVKTGAASDSEPEPEGYVPPPPTANLGDMLAMAIEKGAKGQPSQQGKGGKKGKGKKMKGTKISLTSPHC